MTLTLAEIITAIASLPVADRDRLHQSIYQQEFTRRLNTLPSHVREVVNETIDKPTTEQEAEIIASRQEAYQAISNGTIHRGTARDLIASLAEKDDEYSLE